MAVTLVVAVVAASCSSTDSDSANSDTSTTAVAESGSDGRSDDLGSEVADQGDDRSSQPGELFVLSAGSGTVDDSTITLEDPDPWVTAFTDRPARSATRVSLEEFVKGWSDYGFEEVPPNASLTTEIDGEQRSFVVELTAPSTDSTSGGAITFSYRPIGDSAEVLTPGSRLERPDLFIDDGGATATRYVEYADPQGSKLVVALASLGSDNVDVVAEGEPSESLEEDGELGAFWSQVVYAAVLTGDEMVDPSDEAGVKAAMAKLVGQIESGSLPTGTSVKSPQCMRDRDCPLTFDLAIEQGDMYQILATAIPDAASGSIPSTLMVGVVTFTA